MLITLLEIAEATNSNLDGARPSFDLFVGGLGLLQSHFAVRSSSGFEGQSHQIWHGYCLGFWNDPLIPGLPDLINYYLPGHQSYG